MLPDLAKIRAAFEGTDSWYHRIDVHGMQTPGRTELEPQWAMMREVRDTVDYKDRVVLDVASYDGMWAFEAEQKGAARVVACDCCPNVNFNHFLLVRGLLGSCVTPFYNLNGYNLGDRLDGYVHEFGRFDIVQHLGLLYHLRDPLLSLSQVRGLMSPGGRLFLETAVYDSKDSVMLFNGPSRRVYNDVTTWWVPSLTCLEEMLTLSGFKMEPGMGRYRQDDRISRVACWASVVPVEAMDKTVLAELRRIYRNPGWAA